MQLLATIPDGCQISGGIQIGAIGFLYDCRQRVTVLVGEVIKKDTFCTRLIPPAGVFPPVRL